MVRNLSRELIEAGVGKIPSGEFSYLPAQLRWMVYENAA
jgi:hypothetical protein